MDFQLIIFRGFKPFFCGKIKLLLWVLAFGLFQKAGFSQTIQQVGREINNKVSFRGLSVVNDSIALVSGSQATILKTKDGGKLWQKIEIPDCDKCDFRTCFAFDSSRFLVANAGSPARIFLTNNGGQNWNLVYSNMDKEAFLDGMDFWDENVGVCFGDPINGKMLILLTMDRGKSWLPMANSPILEVGEASFAASGTTISCQPNGSLWIATGGTKSRLWLTEDTGRTWKFVSVPILQGKSSQGIFSFGFSGKKRLIVVGGDYLADSLRRDHIYHSDDFGKTWNFPKMPTRGYRECICFINPSTWIAVGPSGLDISRNDGENWESGTFDVSGFHVIRKARKGSLVLMAGGKGKVAKVSGLQRFK